MYLLCFFVLCVLVFYCFVVLIFIVLCYFHCFVCTSVRLLPQGENPIAVSNIYNNNNNNSRLKSSVGKRKCLSLGDQWYLDSVCKKLYFIVFYFILYYSILHSFNSSTHLKCYGWESVCIIVFIAFFKLFKSLNIT